MTAGQMGLAQMNLVPRPAQKMATLSLLTRLYLMNIHFSGWYSPEAHG